MKSHPCVRKIIKWTGLVVAAGMVVAWIVASVLEVRWTWDERWPLQVGYFFVVGGVVMVTLDAWRRDGWKPRTRTADEEAMRKHLWRRRVRIAIPLLLLAQSAMIARVCFLMRSAKRGLPAGMGSQLNTHIVAALAGAVGFALAAAGAVYWFRPRTVPPGRCLTCGYDLAGLAGGGVCPECGHASP